MRHVTWSCLAVLLVPALAGAATEAVTGRVSVLPGPVNGVHVAGADVAVYGLPSDELSAKHLLLTHHRRDVLRDARATIVRGASASAPATERAFLDNPQAFWDAFTTKRFHDYDQQSTKIATRPLKIDRWVKGGDSLKHGDVTFRVIDTPGFTRGAVSYVAKIDKKIIAFTGDLIYGDAQLFDLYSFQDAVPEANIRGYHGYASRLGSLVPSLRKIQAEKPDIIIPARGPVIRNPNEAIEKLISRVQAVVRNYLSTQALNWYFKEKRLTQYGERVLGKDAGIKLMSYSLHQDTPDWIWVQGTSRMLISDEGRGFLLDCGNQRVIDGIKRLMEQKLVTRVDGIFVTHYHDDHTDSVAAAAKEFDCPVYATPEYEHILEHPDAYHMPAMTANAIADVKAMKSGSKLKWQEFDLTFFFYPGQAFYHGALLVKRKDFPQVFFIGDAFSPSGIDDYCLLNRNLIHEDAGYFKCLKMIRGLGPEYWLINEHIPHVFRFSPKELDYLESQYQKRKEVLSELFPWDDPNYGIDEQWAFFNPYGVKSKAESKVQLDVAITNHSPEHRTFHVKPQVPPGFRIVKAEQSLTLAPRRSGRLKIHVQTGKATGNFVVTADVESGTMKFNDWMEALITVEGDQR